MTRPFALWCLAALALCSAPAALAQLSITPLLGDHAVVQQGRPVPVWGGPLPVLPSPSHSAATRHKPVPTAKDDGRRRFPPSPPPARTS